jgi:hypothetical protein
MRYAITMKDGSVRIMETFHEWNPELSIAKWPRADQAAVASIRAINEEDIPADRTFRDAWKSDLTVDMEKARGIVTERMKLDVPSREILEAKTPEELKAIVSRGEVDAKPS